MFAKRKRNKQSSSTGTALAIQSVEGVQLRAFPPDVVNKVRRMITELTYQSDLPSRVSVISALREEGVTYTTLALATTIATDLSASVCVVELNWWSSGLLQQLTKLPAPYKKHFWSRKVQDPTPLVAPPNSAGLAAALLGTATLDEVLISTALPNLKLLPAGDMPVSQRASMARSPRLMAYINALSQRFDFLLLDIPAITATSDAIALASLGTAACVIVRQGVTPASVVQRALDEVQHMQILGVVLNQSKTYIPAWMHTLLPQE